MKIKLSKAQWEFIGKKARWMKKAVINDDGYADSYADGREPYTDEEMDLIELAKKSMKYFRELVIEIGGGIINETPNEIKFFIPIEGIDIEAKITIAEAE